VQVAAKAEAVVYELDPLSDTRWDDFVHAHPQASVFHSTNWLRALRDTYGYQPSVLCTSAPGKPLTSGWVFCRVKSWLTGNRIISLPFSDHCEALVDTVEERDAILQSFKGFVETQGWDYVELRPIREMDRQNSDFQACATYLRHVIDLSKSSDALFRRFHKDCIQRKIRRAERESLSYEVGNSAALLSSFYKLFVMTRCRFHMPPQPYIWFEQLAAAFGDQLQIRLASYRGRPAAAMLTLKDGRTALYKYGCTDIHLNRLGGMPFLFWRAIEESKHEQLESFDLGRSDIDNAGLITFKDRLGAESEVVRYQKFPAPGQGERVAKSSRGLGRMLLRFMPERGLRIVGRALYPHIA